MYICTSVLEPKSLVYLFICGSQDMHSKVKTPRDSEIASAIGGTKKVTQIAATH